MRIRGEISKNKDYHIDKNRYYELKYFCLQFDTWWKALKSLDGFAKRGDSPIKGPDISDPTAKCVEARDSFLSRCQMILESAEEASPELSHYILEGATKGLSFDVLNARYGIPCCRKVYYEAYRRFFWILSRKRL